MPAHLAPHAGEATASAPGVHAPTEHIHPGGEVHVHGGEDEGRVGYYVKVNFPHAGGWGIAVEAILKDGTRGVASVGFNVQEKPAVPAPGQPAPRSDNLTKDDVDDIRKVEDDYRAKSKEILLEDWLKRPRAEKLFDNLMRLTSSLQ